MANSQWLDLVLVLLILGAAASGFRQGALVSVWSFIGVALGAVAGILIAPVVGRQFDDPRWKLIFGIVLVIVFVISGELSGMVIGKYFRNAFHNRWFRLGDNIFGAVCLGFAAILGVWVVASPLKATENNRLAAAVGQSDILSGFNALIPPRIKTIPNDLAELVDNSGFREVMGPFGRVRIAQAALPDPEVVNLAIVRTISGSVVKIEGIAPSCNRALEGTGFVVGKERVITNAHVVAGTRSVQITAPEGPLKASVIFYDPSNDIAVLDVPGLTAPALRWATASAKNGDDAVVLGYPGGGPLNISAQRVRGEVGLTSPDIYGIGQVVRKMYTVRGTIKQGNSGGPLVNRSGEVLGVVFGVSDDPAAETGFALTANQVADNVRRAELSHRSISTRGCVTSESIGQ